MIKVITYGTYDVLHYGHIRLLQRAKALGDYLIVGVTSDDYDKSRGKINNRQSLSDRMEAVRKTGIADEVIVEEYDGQKIDDIRKYGIDVFTVGSDWEGKFDYLNAYCKVVYLPRTEGVSSSDIRSESRKLKIGVTGESVVAKKFIAESKYVNGCEIAGICSQDKEFLAREFVNEFKTDDFSALLDRSDAVYIASHPSLHYVQAKEAILRGKHVLCESPIATSEAECAELFALAKEKDLILMDGIKTAYSTAYARMLLLVESGEIGQVMSVDATCTSLRYTGGETPGTLGRKWNSMCDWGPIALLPVFQLLGVEYEKKTIVSAFADEKKTFDYFSKIDFVYKNAVATVKVGNGVKAEGELIVAGTKGYVYVPAPWWKTDYFEIRFEHPENNKRYFYQLNGEGIRYEIVSFVKAIENGKSCDSVPEKISEAICRVISSRDRIEI